MISKLKINSTIAIVFLLSGCGGSETFDGSSKEAAEASLMAMYGESGATSAKDAPPGLEAYMCFGLKQAFTMAFSGASEAEVEQDLNSKFDGMTSAEMEQFGIENDVMGCLEGLEELGKAFD